MRFLTLFLLAVLMVLAVPSAKAQPFLPSDAIAYGEVQAVTADASSMVTPSIYIGKGELRRANGIVLYAKAPFRMRKWSLYGANSDSLVTFPVDTTYAARGVGAFSVEYPCQITIRDVTLWKVTFGTIAGSDSVWGLPFYFKP